MLLAVDPDPDAHDGDDRRIGQQISRVAPGAVGAVGVGFQRSVMMIEEPPGFDGTRFASPLFAGLTALLPEPKDAAEMAGL